MMITCPKCKTRLKLPDEKLKPEGTRFRCSKCGASLFYRAKVKSAPKESARELTPMPPSQPSQESQPTGAFFESQQVEKEGPVTPQKDIDNIQPIVMTSAGPKIDEKKETEGEMEAYLMTSAQYQTPFKEVRQKVVPRKAVIAGGAAGIVVLILAAIFFFYSQMTPDQPLVKGVDKGPATSTAPSQSKGPLPPAGTPGVVPSEPAPAATISEQPVTEERAIEIVKRSEALLKRTSVDSIVTKWAEKNAAKFKVIGWQAKKKDEQKYLVSFTAMDGDTPKGFYFEVDVASGTVQNLAQNPELQTK